MNNHTLQFMAELLAVDKDSRLEQLEAEIEYLLQNNLEKLLWILYRIDVDEEKLKQALSISNQADHKTVTHLLIERCGEIIATRKNFSSDTSGWSFDIED